jgi:hypothetical protein
MSCSIFKRPSAHIPIAMSCAALAVVLYHIAAFGTARQPDEGTEAHLWQILMAGQLPVVIWFMAKWLSRAPEQAVPVLALQATCGLAALAPVFLFNW